jgi:hypothetical protein
LIENPGHLGSGHRAISILIAVWSEAAMLNPEISTQEELRNRSKQFALRIIRLFQKRPRSPEAQILGKQLLRSGTSVGANARAAGRARSKPEFIAKIGIVVEEADETVFLARMPC